MPRPRILVVDDNRDAADVLLAWLGRRVFRLAWAHDGLTGLALAKVTKPDLLVLNWQMPGMDGFQVLKELRADPATARMKVIMTSGHQFIAQVAEQRGLEAHDYIVYPVKADEFGTTVDRVLGEPR